MIMTTKKMEEKVAAPGSKPVKDAPKEKKAAMDAPHKMPEKTKTEHPKEKKKDAPHHH